jgi:hypothetical protein
MDNLTPEALAPTAETVFSANSTCRSSLAA